MNDVVLKPRFSCIFNTTSPQMCRMLTESDTYRNFLLPIFQVTVETPPTLRFRDVSPSGMMSRDTLLSPLTPFACTSSGDDIRAG